jgi:hypothetical protein
MSGFEGVTLFEKEDRVGGKVHTIVEDGYNFEMGAVWVGRGYDTIESLAKQYGVKLEVDSVEHFIRTKSGSILTLAECFREGRRPLDLLKCLLAWQRVQRKFASIGQVGGFFHAIEPDLMMPFAEFAEKYGIGILASFFRPFWIGCGYQYFEEIPALYVLKLMFFFDYSLTRAVKQMLPVQRWRANSHLRQIVGGYQHLWERVSERIPDIRLNHKVERIVRPDVGSSAQVYITANGQTYGFDAVILAMDVRSIRRSLVMTDEEQSVLGEVNTYRYITRLCEIRGMGHYAGRMVLLDENGTRDRVGHMTSFICRKERPNLIFTSQLIGELQTDDDLVCALEADIESLGGELVAVRRSVVWDYLPYADGRALGQGFYHKIANLQGRGNCWFVGGLMNFESVEGTAAFAKSCISALV